MTIRHLTTLAPCRLAVLFAGAAGAAGMALEAPQTQQWSDACFSAARAATECADWCIQQADSGMEDCIRYCLDTAVLCTAAPRMMARESGHAQAALRACQEAAAACADSCASHAQRHDSVDRCESACRDAADVVATVLERQS